MQTGLIIDFYDDPNGVVLAQKVSKENLPDFVKTAEFLDEDRRARLPDDVFALVMVDEGEGIRKYACTDKGNTALSVIYFLENKDKLPEEAQKLAAANLVAACGWYEMEPPVHLKKIAGLGTALQVGMGGMQLKGKVQEGLAQHRSMMGKAGDLSGSQIMPKQSDRPEDEEKYASMNPYVDVTGKKPPYQVEKVASQRMLLNGRFPVDTYGEVQQARQWFSDYGTSLHPVERREYCTKLAARATELGMVVEDQIGKYAGSGYAPDEELEAAVCTRMQFWADEAPERGLLYGLMEKRAEVTPGVFCDALRQLDEATGLSNYWDRGVVDPYFSTFGIDKEAGTGWTYEYGGDRVDEEMLKCLSRKGHKHLCKTFGKELAEAFQKNPREIFDSLPLDSKRIIMRMANDPQP